MNVEFPPPTITLGHAELNEAVQDYLVKTRRLQNGGTLADYRLGNLTATDLQPCRAISSPRAWVVGTFTFELLKD